MQKEKHARFPPRPLAPPSPAAAASRSPGKETPQANHTSEPRYLKSKKCLPAPCGRWRAAAHLVGVSVVSGARAGFSPPGRRPTADRISPSALPLALLPDLMHQIGKTNYCEIKPLYPVLKQFLIIFPSRSFETCSLLLRSSAGWSNSPGIWQNGALLDRNRASKLRKPTLKLHKKLFPCPAATTSIVSVLLVASCGRGGLCLRWRR
jgi:hypothetical protein